MDGYTYRGTHVIVVWLPRKIPVNILVGIRIENVSQLWPFWLELYNLPEDFIDQIHIIMWIYSIIV